MATLCPWHESVVEGVMSDVTTDDAAQIRVDLTASLARSCGDCDEGDGLEWVPGVGWVEHAQIERADESAA